MIEFWQKKSKMAAVAAILIKLSDISLELFERLSPKLAQMCKIKFSGNY